MRKILFIFAAMLLSSIGLYAGNTITYTASEKLPGYEGSLDVGKNTFGPAITSHTFSNGTGTITCNGEITKIGKDAFYKCKNLTLVTIPNSVTTIGKQAFYICSGLTSITIPQSVTTIEEQAFEGSSTSLTSIVVASGNPQYDSRDNCNAIIEKATNTLILGCKHTKIPNNITTIGRSAFDGCYDLKDITIPNSVTTIGRSAFWECKNLTSITIPNSVTTIGINAFAGAGLTSITIPASVKEINDNAFWDCTGLSSVKVNWTDAQSIVSINSNVFQEIANGAGPAGATLHVPAGTYNLYKQANVWKDFGNIIAPNCKITYTASEKLPGLNVGATTFGHAITSHIFSDGKGTITCAGEITQIGAYAFNGCTGLTSITIPNTVTTIGMGAFGGCSGLTSITIPQSVTTIGDEAFKGSSTGLTSIVVAGSNPQYDSRDNCNAIIETATNTLILGCKNTKVPNNITTIGDYAFYGCYDLKDITLPNSITAIGQSAFWECKNLTSITIPSSVTSIGMNAFAWAGLTSITLPASVKEINEHAFWNCTGLSSVKVNWTDAQSIVSINSNVFQGIANGAGLASATLYVPGGTDNLYKQADVWKEFGNIIELAITYKASEQLSGEQFNTGATTFGPAITSHEFSNGKGTIVCNGEITKIGEKAFYECKNLTSVTIPNSVTTIGEKAFYVCSGLTSITIPASVTSIGETAFEGSSTGLTSIVVAGGNPKYDSRDNCNAIIEKATNTLILGCKNTKVPNNITTIGRSAFDGCYDLKDITLPNSVTTIGRSAFWECKNLTSITIPNSVTTIGINAFAGAGLASITIPASVKEINEHAFWDCTGLSSVTVSWTDAQSIPSINSNVFQGIANGAGLASATLYVPGGTANLYQQANVWKDFGHIIDPNTITYTASEKLGYNSLNVGSTTFGPAIISHEFSDGKGTITCSGEITTIGDKAFYGCKNLTSVTIPNTVTRVGHYAFCGSGLLSIVIPDFVTSIGMEAFGGCTSLTVMTIGQSVKELLWTALWNCWALKTIYCFPLNPPFLDVDIFRGIPREGLSVYVLDVKAYSDQSAWGSQLPASCFKPMPPVVVGDLRYEFFDGNKARVVAKDGGYTGNVVIPQQVTYQGMNFAVTEIGQSAFKNCTGLTSVIIPKSVTTIGMDAFWQCSNLSSVTIPNSVTTIGQSAFFETGLTSVTIPASVKEIGTWAFKNCTQLKDLQFADRTDAINIGIYAFENMALEEVVIPDWMAVIPEGLFYNNKKLKGIYLHEEVNTIGYRPFGACPFEYIISMSQMPPTLADGAFEGHNKDANVIVYVPTSDAVIAYRNSPWSNWFKDIISNFTYEITSTSTAELTFAVPVNGRVDIPPTALLQGNFYTVTSIGKGAFYYPNKDNEDLQYITLSPTVKYIRSSAFKQCTKLANLLLSEDLETIGDSAFYGCANLDSITIPEGVQSIGKAAFMGCQRLVYLDMDALNKLRNIPDDCFRNCGLQEITLPEGVETIGRQGFDGNKPLHMIELPSTLGNINAGAFDGCNAMDTVICRAENPPALGEKVFSHSNTAVLYVPHRDVINKYSESAWKNYKFRFMDLMAEENKQYLHFVADTNTEAQAIAKAYCDSIDNATSTRQVEYFTNTALVKIDKYTLSDYKAYLARQLDSIAAGNTDAERIAEEYGQKVIRALFRQDAEKLFAEGLAKIKDIWDLIYLKDVYCDNLIGSAQGMGDMVVVANDYCSRLQRATSKQEVDNIYKQGSQEIAIYVHKLRYWINSQDGDPCRHTQGYQY